MPIGWVWITPLSGRPARWNARGEPGRGGLPYAAACQAEVRRRKGKECVGNGSSFSIGAASEQLFANSNLVVIHKGEKKLVGQQNVIS